MLNLLKKFREDKRGVIMPMSVILLPILLLYTAFGLDYGRAYILKHQLQGAADAAALAGTSETEVHLVFDAVGNAIGVKPVINQALADAEADSVFDSNITLTNMTAQGVTIVSKNMQATDETHYFVEVLADIDTYISGPIIAMWNGDPAMKKVRVRRNAVAEVRL